MKFVGEKCQKRKRTPVIRHSRVVVGTYLFTFVCVFVRSSVYASKLKIHSLNFSDFYGSKFKFSIADEALWIRACASVCASLRHLISRKPLIRF